ncbi:hypothetical protein [Clostridium hydrogeniformans]|uniref:hypothetical protein n=1 Tax=Clostridium hydrogeniformans TaxID=349933 RepID=UPI00123769E1|nr:hypothetical protein [Clostridium hydrogeniformans]
MDKFIKNKINIIENSIKELQDKKTNNDSMEDFKSFQHISINIERIITSILELTSNFVNSKNLKMDPKLEGIFKDLYKNKIIDENMLSVMEETLSFRGISLDNSREVDLDSIKKFIENKLNYSLEFAYIIANNITA